MNRIQLRNVYLALFSLNAACFAVTVALATNRAFWVWCMGIEISLNRLFHIRQTDYIRGYFEFWVPSIPLAVLLWGVLLAAVHRGLIKRSHLLVSGMMVILAPVALRTIDLLIQYDVWWLDPPVVWETVAAVVFALLILLGRRKLPLWLAVILLFAHFRYWGLGVADPEIPNYRGPAGPILGLAAALAWTLYVAQCQSKPTSSVT